MSTPNQIKGMDMDQLAISKTKSFISIAINQDTMLITVFSDRVNQQRITWL